MLAISILIAIALTGLIVVLILQDAGRYTASGRFSSLLDTIALVCILLIVAALTVPRLLYPGHLSPVTTRLRALTWSVVALFCVWRAFSNRPR